MARKDWTKEELEFVKANYSTKGRNWVANKLDRSEMSVRLKANSLGLSVVKKPIDLNVESYLRENHSLETSKQLAQNLGLTEKQIHSRLKVLGIIKKRHNSFWTAEMDQDLIKLAKVENLANLSRYFGTQHSTVQLRASQLGVELTKAIIQTKWTQADVSFLQATYGKLSVEEIADALSKTVGAVRKRADMLGLMAPKCFSDTTPERQVKEVLTGLGIEFDSQRSLLTGLTKRHFYKPDFVLRDNLLIEVFGDYWHCNPNKYPNGPRTSAQINNVERDKVKKEWYRSSGYKLLTIWESDCKDSAILKSVITDFLSANNAP